MTPSISEFSPLFLGYFHLGDRFSTPPNFCIFRKKGGYAGGVHGCGKMTEVPKIVIFDDALYFLTLYNGHTWSYRQFQNFPRYI